MVDSVTAALANASKGSADASRSSLANNFEMFLVLLTEQLKNQDPLNPLESNEFVSQLVQFSSVEQQINQNSSLEKLIGLQVAGVGGATVGYLGKEIRVDTNETHLDADGADWTYAVDGEAKSVKLTVSDAAGKLVYSTEGSIEPGEHGFRWDGKDNAGVALPAGAYTLGVAALDADSKSLPTSVATFGVVTGVDLSGAEPVLLMGEARAPFSLIQAVRDPLEAQPAPEDATENDQT
jgi:flagellar basal-body rod modification protein FlgD